MAENALPYSQTWCLYWIKVALNDFVLGTSWRHLSWERNSCSVLPISSAGSETELTNCQRDHFLWVFGFASTFFICKLVIRFIPWMKFLAHSTSWCWNVRSVWSATSLQATQRNSFLMFSEIQSWGHISDPADVCSTCEGTHYRGIKCESQVIGDRRKELGWFATHPCDAFSSQHKKKTKARYLCWMKYVQNWL